MTLARFKQALGEQWAILALDEGAAIDSLPQLLPADVGERRALVDKVRSIFAATHNADTDVQRRLREIERLLVDQTTTDHDREIRPLPWTGEPPNESKRTQPQSYQRKRK